MHVACEKSIPRLAAPVFHINFPTVSVLLKKILSLSLEEETEEVPL